MKIHSLSLQNFRGFEKLDLPLDPSLTVLIGENGAGKTAVLDALAIVLDAICYELMDKWSRDLDVDDVRVVVHDHQGLLDRQPQWPANVLVKGTLDGLPLEFGVSRASAEQRAGRNTSQKATQQLFDFSEAIKAGESRALPVIASYGTQRLWPRQEIVQVKRGVGSRFDGYAHALDAEANHKQLAEWMFQQTIVELQRRQALPHLRAIERAVCACIEGATRFFFDVQSQGLIVERKGTQVLPLALLSDGYRNMVALVADIAWRSVVLNPHYGAEAPERSEGVVLIDEIDLHLHPRWQRRVLGDLCRAFPQLQFVVTTHSPQVLASAHREQVRVLRSSALLDVRPFVEGRDTNSLLEDVFHVSERDEAVRTRIEEMAALLDDERYEEGAKLLENLEAQLGPDDPAIIRAHWVLAHEAALRDHV